MMVELAKAGVYVTTAMFENVAEAANVQKIKIDSKYPAKQNNLRLRQKEGRQKLMNHWIGAPIVVLELWYWSSIYQG
jgi:hypothetical protein